jgi:hypothetical protein
MAQCKNCESQFSGSYCPTCGQKDVDLERPMRELVGEVVKETFDLDGRAWRTVKTLFLHPGLLTSEFLAGKRRAYTSPLRLYLFISVSFFILMAWVASQGMLLELGQSPGPDAAMQARFMSDELPRLMFVLLPVFALLLKIFFSRRLYFDHLIFSVHLHSAAYVVLALMLPLERVSTNSWPALILQVALFAYFIIYLIVSLRRVYRTTWIGATVRAVAILFGYMIAVSGLIEANSSFQIISD